MMKIKQDPISKLWCREDGAVLLPPASIKFRKFRWTFGCKNPAGYCVVCYCHRLCKVHQIICRAFNGLAPEGKPFVDHINRIKHDNRPSNLRWVDRKENNDNRDYVDRALEEYGVRYCEDPKAYGEAYRAKKKAQGLSCRKGSDGKWGWYPFKQTKPAL